MEISFSRTKKLLISSISKENIPEEDFEFYIARNFIRNSLTTSIRQRILSELIPFVEEHEMRLTGLNVWKYGCLHSHGGSKFGCKLHPECKLLYNFCPKILQLLFTNDIRSLRINLKKLSATSCEETLYTLATMMKNCKLSNVIELMITGCHTGINVYLPLFEDLCYYVKKNAPYMQKLHLPIASNDCLRSTSKMPRLCSLTVERSQHLNHKGLTYLCDRNSCSRFGLKICHIGVFKHHAFNKLDVTEFLEKMTNLSSFSLMDEHRALVNEELIGAKVFTYSALKLALTRSVFLKNNSESKSTSHHDDQVQHEQDNQDVEVISQNFQCALKELKIVDRQLKPQYILETCPDLQSLHIDWQEELSEVPFEEYPSDWFNDLVKNPDWHQLANTLTSLKIVFPAKYSVGGYSCDPETLMCLVRNMTELEHLSLKGMKNDLVPLDQMLTQLPKLKELVWSDCSLVHFNHNQESQSVVHKSLKSLHITDAHFLPSESSEILENVSKLAPNLEELVLRPKLPSTFGGFLLNDIWKLSNLQHLNRLEITISTSDCSNNMPELVYVLRDFPSLRYLIISWGVHIDLSNIKIARLLSWLISALEGDNANIHVQICYAMHSSLYSSPPANSVLS